MSTYAAKDSIFMYESQKIEARCVVKVHSVSLIRRRLRSLLLDVTLAVHENRKCS